MQQSRDKYFPQFENQGINPIGYNTQIERDDRERGRINGNGEVGERKKRGK